MPEHPVTVLFMGCTWSMYSLLAYQKKYLKNYSLSKAKALLYTIAVTQHIAWSMPVLLMAICLTRKGPNWHPLQTHDALKNF